VGSGAEEPEDIIKRVLMKRRQDNKNDLEDGSAFLVYKRILAVGVV
jgi:hypothetical protein